MHPRVMHGTLWRRASLAGSLAGQVTYAATRELRELRIREELQGELHPRTQQARRKYMTMIEERLKTKGPNYSAIDIAIETQSAESGNASTVVVAKMLSEQVVSSLRPHTLVA